MEPLSGETLRRVFPQAPEVKIEAFAAQNGPLFARFGLDVAPVRRAFFLAQVAHECGGLTIDRERLTYTTDTRLMEVFGKYFRDLAEAHGFLRRPEALANRVYADRMGNGPERSGDGWRYRGGGYIQITGRDGYRQVGARAGLDLEAEPDLACDPRHALLCACAFWQWKDLNPYCDLGDFEKVTYRINGGYHGLDDRKAKLARVRAVLGLDEPFPTPPSQAEAEALQAALAAAGHAEVGRVDGDIGPKTIKATRNFRAARGLPADPLFDQPLWAALDLAA